LDGPGIGASRHREAGRDAELLNSIVPALSDKNHAVRCTAAAAVIRLTALPKGKKDVESRMVAKSRVMLRNRTTSERRIRYTEDN
jgi:hypothetical protein